MKKIYWITGIIILLIILAGIYYYFNQTKHKCEFGNFEECDNSCEINADCKSEIGYCFNINENVDFPEGQIPAYYVANCTCESNKCLGTPTGEIAI